MDLNLVSLSEFDFAKSIDLVAQIVLLIVLLLYGLFNLLVYKQVKILNQTIHTPTSGIVNKVALIQLAVIWLFVIIVILLILL